jgi:hypothetical protein
VKPNFTVANEQVIAVPPTVDFGDAPARSSAPPAPSGAGSGTGPPVTK